MQHLKIVQSRSDVDDLDFKIIFNIYLRMISKTYKLTCKLYVINSMTKNIYL